MTKERMEGKLGRTNTYTICNNELLGLVRVPSLVFLARRNAIFMHAQPKDRSMHFGNIFTTIVNSSKETQHVFISL